VPGREHATVGIVLAHRVAAEPLLVVFGISAEDSRKAESAPRRVPVFWKARAELKPERQTDYRGALVHCVTRPYDAPRRALDADRV